ncbi:uncharacterized protein M6B38_263495 [Iris pallida]|uniref:CCHC-type domain-containing protein n=1 Tax=Iris pallida TaxID=29817 RepID=A0AAX6ICQ0_IRIPA|nr:uncharacterized protein M6B38_263495 [Iris pallida]
MPLQSSRTTSISVTPSAVIADNEASHGPQDSQTPQRTQEPQEGHMPAVLHLLQQRPYAPYPQQFQQLDGRHLILQFFQNMVQAQEQHTEILRKGVEGIRDRKQRQQAGGPMRRSQTQQRQKAAPYQIREIPICQFCKRRGHIPEDCRRRLGLCLVCGSNQHHAKGCSKATKMIERPALPECRVSHPEYRVDQLPVPGEYPSRLPLPDQAAQFEEARKKAAIERVAKQRAQQALTMTSKVAQTSEVVDAGSFQHPSVSVDVQQPAS